MVIGDFGSICHASQIALMGLARHQELELGARARHSELGILVSLLFVLRSAKAGWKYLRPPCELVKAGLGRLGALIRFSYLDLCGCPDQFERRGKVDSARELARHE
ncbi:unnamed protein product [Prunus armeniaca]